MASKTISKIIILLVLSFTLKKAHGQSVCIYLTDDQTYVNSLDGGKIIFYKNGRVAINGKIERSFSYKHFDCQIKLYHKGKLINTLTHSANYLDPNVNYELPDKYNCDCLIDSRKIVYTHPQIKNKQ